MSSSKSGHKKDQPKSGPHRPKSDVSHWIEKYIQSHLDGNKTLKKLYGDIILKLGGKIPKL
jgi:hypothetical protein